MTNDLDPCTVMVLPSAPNRCIRSSSGRTYSVLPAAPHRLGCTNLVRAGVCCLGVGWLKWCIQMHSSGAVAHTYGRDSGSRTFPSEPRTCESEPRTLVRNQGYWFESDSNPPTLLNSKLFSQKFLIRDFAHK